VRALWRFWQIRGHLMEGRERADAALAMTGAAEAGEAYLAALEAAGGLDYWLADFARATERYEALVRIRRAQGEARAIAEALYNFTFTALFGTIDHARARELAEEALGLFHDAGDRAGVAKALWVLGLIARDQDDVATGRARCQEAIAILRNLDDVFLLAWALYTLGQIEARAGNLDLCATLLGEALDLFATAEDQSGFVLVLDGLAILALLLGDRQRAARLAGAVATLEATTGTGLNPANRTVLHVDPSSLRDEADTAAAWAEGRAMSSADAVAYARLGAAARPTQAATRG
jgi:tetratricopeptide (TPR) repeat protein